jgi:Na+-translocating ferredoxin:NAD+ oxidoreductase RnfG subunit
MIKTILRTGLIAAIIAVLSLGLIAPVNAAPKGEKIVFLTEFVSEKTTLNVLPGDYTYGWNYLTSATKIDGKPGKVQFLGVVNYQNGSGPFGGFVTVTLDNGSILGLAVDGQGLSLAQGSGTADARFGGSIKVISGTGDFNGAQGMGTMTGSRASTLGSPVPMKFNLTLKK